MFAGAFCALLLAGCASTYESGTKIDDALVASLQVGKTTHQGVAGKLGQPFSALRNSDGSTSYVYAHSTATSNGFQVSSQSRSLTLTFGADGKLSSYSESNYQPPTVKQR